MTLLQVWQYILQGRGAPSPQNWKKSDFLAYNRDFSHEIPQKCSRLPPLGAIFLSAPPPYLEFLDPPLYYIVCVMSRPGLTLRQNKHVLRTSRGTTKIRPQGNLFYQPDIRLKNTPKIPKNVGKPNWCTRQATSSFTEASIRYSECCQKLMDAYPDSLNSHC